MKEGAISFDKVEVKFELNEENEPIGVFFKTSLEANKLIEEFMLLANKKVAEFIGKQTPKKLLYIVATQNLMNLNWLLYRLSQESLDISLI